MARSRREEEDDPSNPCKECGQDTLTKASFCSVDCEKSYDSAYDYMEELPLKAPELPKGETLGELIDRLWKKQVRRQYGDDS